MMLSDATLPEIKNYATHEKISKKYGAKAAGLSFLPKAWRLDFFSLSVKVHNSWRKEKDLNDNNEVKEMLEWLRTHSYDEIILRSSGCCETLEDRGKFKSRILKKGWTTSKLLKEVVEIYKDAKTVDDGADLGIVVQNFIEADYTGHLSNEHRVSPSVNRWQYELETPQWLPSKGIDSKDSISPNPEIHLTCGNKIPHQALRSVAHYLADEFSERCHIEWLVRKGILFIMQIDFEWQEIDTGLNPKEEISINPLKLLNLDCQTYLQPYKIGSETKWPKLSNLSDFDFNNDDIPAPRIYPLEPNQVISAFKKKKEYDNLINEITALTGNHLVVRTDCINDEVDKFNLPRTDTINANDAINWCRGVINNFEQKNIKQEEIIFLFHAFLPARASAWAYAKPDNPVVVIDALWGLPDGMQVLPVDTYEVNVVQQKVEKTKSTFKPSF